MILPLAALTGVVLLSAAAQIALKHGAGQLEIRRGVRAFLASLTPGLVAAGIAFTAAPILYFFALTRFDLGFAYVVTALTQALVIFGGRIFLRERLRPLHLAGTFLIIGGILLWNL